MGLKPSHLCLVFTTKWKERWGLEGSNPSNKLKILTPQIRVFSGVKIIKMTQSLLRLKN